MPFLDHHTALYTDYYELAMAQGYFLEGRTQKTACFDYFFRKLPFQGGYVIFAGLQDVLEVLENLTFQQDDLAYLQSLGFDNGFLSYLKDFRFNGSVFSAKEGEVIFPLEPVLRVQGNIIETQIIETVLLNIINFESLIATKASRLRRSAGHRTLSDFGLRRAQGLGGIHASKAAIIGGVDTTSNVYSAYTFGLTPSGTMAHSWIESFDDELEAFRVFARIYPDKCILLADTYDTLKSGLPNAIQVAHEMEKAGHRLLGIRLDSGDLAYLSKQARLRLDAAGLHYVKIAASNLLDEYIIKSLLDQGAPIDIFGVGTSLAVGKDDGALDGVYKLSMYDHVPRLKISDNIEKVLLPGIKKLCRYYSREGLFHADAIMLDQEDPPDGMIHPYQPARRLTLKDIPIEELLGCVMQGGKTVIPHQDPYAVAGYAKSRLALLPEDHKRFEYPHIYKVGISARLMEMRDSMVSRHS